MKNVVVTRQIQLLSVCLNRNLLISIQIFNILNNSQISYSYISASNTTKDKMPPVVSVSFKQYLRSANSIKLSSDAAVTRIIYEGLTNFESLQDFDKKSIESLTSTCKEKSRPSPKALLLAFQPS